MSQVTLVHSDARSVKTPLVSALIAAWNEAHLIGRCIESLLTIQRLDLEIVVCAGGIDDTYEIARRYECERVIVLQQYSGEGKQAALRRAYAASTGDIIYFTDADCVISELAIRNLLAPIISSDFLAASGRSIPLIEQQSNNLVRYHWARDANWAYHERGLANGVFGRNSAVQRSVLDRLKPFDDDVSSGTDYHLSQLLHGANVPIASTLSLVESEFPEYPGAYVHMWRRWIRNVLLRGYSSGSYRELFTALSGVLIAFTGLMLPLLALLFDRRLALPGLALLGMVASRRYRAQRLMEEKGRVPATSKLVLRVPFYVVLDWIAAVYAGVSCLVPAMRRRW